MLPKRTFLRLEPGTAKTEKFLDSLLFTRGFPAEEESVGINQRS